MRRPARRHSLRPSSPKSTVSVSIVDSISIIHSRLPATPFSLKSSPRVRLAYPPLSTRLSELDPSTSRGFVHGPPSVRRRRPPELWGPKPATRCRTVWEGGALEQSSSRNKLQQGQANRINPLETYPKLLLHHSRASGLAPLYVHGQIERVVAQDSSPALPYCSVLRDDCEAMIIRMVRARDDSRAKEGCGYLVGEYNDTEDAAMR